MARQLATNYSVLLGDVSCELTDRDFFKDLIHPNDYGNEKIARQFYHYLAQLLPAPKRAPSGFFSLANVTSPFNNRPKPPAPSPPPKGKKKRPEPPPCPPPLWATSRSSQQPPTAASSEVSEETPPAPTPQVHLRTTVVMEPEPEGAVSPESAADLATSARNTTRRTVEETGASHESQGSDETGASGSQVLRSPSLLRAADKPKAAQPVLVDSFRVDDKLLSLPVMIGGLLVAGGCARLHSRWRRI